MKELRYTLLSDGSSDKAFIPILNWLFQENKVRLAVQAEWANLGQLPKPPKSLEDRITIALQLYPCDLLFIHRDAENQTRDDRIQEIQKALQKIKIADRQPIIYIIPIRMLRAREREKIHRIAWEINDFSTLRQLTAFQALEKDIQNILQQNNWI
jgi:hypothetical protein